MVIFLSRWLIQDYDRPDDPEVRRKYGVLCGSVGIGLNLLLFLAKFFAGTISGSIAITVNDYAAFRTAWESCVSAYASLTDNKGMWFEIAYPSGSNLDSFYFPGEPLPLGFGGADVDSVLENNANIAPTGDYLFAAASTTSA